MLNILTEPIIRVNLAGGAADWVSLPETYARLLADEVDTFPALRPHQRHAWHAFLCQLAAMALHRAGQKEPPAATDAWAILLRGLTPEWPQDEPWSLVGDDITKPAFMQPPAGSAAKEADYKSRVDTPDELDMLVTSKNHDLKGAVAAPDKADDWMFALITTQTMDGNPGRNPGISRMNGAHGNRPAFSLTSSARTGIHLKRDIRALLENRPALLENYPMVDDGIGLLWLESWNGTDQLSLRRLDPFYLEVCRRFRLLCDEGGRVYALKAPAKSMRIAAKQMKGIVGDPWTPIDRKNDKSLTLSKGGFTYKRTTEYLTSPDWEWPLLLNPTSDELSSTGNTQLVARATVRGQGKTEGYYERIIPLRPKVVRTVMGRASGAVQELGDIAKARVGDVGRTQRILSHAISVFAARGKAEAFKSRLDEIVDAGFFDDLQTEFEADADERENIRAEWQLNTLVANARQILKAAADSLPYPAIYRYKARVRAESVLEVGLRSRDGFPSLFKKSDKEEVECRNKNSAEPASNPVGAQMPLFE